MPILASVETLRNNIGYDDMTDINSALKGALMSATPHLAAKLNTSFDRATAKDVFMVPTVSLRSGGAYFTQYRLSNGFLTSDPYIARRGVSYDAILTGDPLNVTNWQVNLQKGLLADFGTLYDRDLVMIQYTYGFETEVIEGVSVYKDVPDWLQEAALLQAQILMENHPLFKEASVTLDSKAMRYSLDILLANYIRYAPSALYPM